MYSDSMPLLSGLGQVNTKPGTQHGPANVLGGLEKLINPFAGIYYGNSGAGPQTVGQLPPGVTLKAPQPLVLMNLPGHP
jgi:hypothetical protein